MEIEDGWAALQFDLACLTVGRWVENRLEERDDRGRRINTLEGLLRESFDGAQDAAQDAAQGRAFMPLLGRATKRLEVPESGVW